MTSNRRRIMMAMATSESVGLPTVITPSTPLKSMVYLFNYMVEKYGLGYGAETKYTFAPIEEELYFEGFERISNGFCNGVNISKNGYSVRFHIEGNRDDDSLRLYQNGKIEYYWVD